MLHLHPCTIFLNQFLAKRNLRQATGKPLYTYKTNQAEYETLKTILATAPPADSASACFVLYATEWWRRNYSGGSWEWEPIFAEIRRPHWNTYNRRGAMMTTGCRFWNRPIFQHEDGPNSLLGTLFFESGLPLRMLKSDGYISDLIRKAFSFLQTYQTRPDDTVACIRDLARAGQLPASLNVDSFFTLIYDVISALLQFKKQYQLGQQEQPLTCLNECVPDWREELPVRIDDNAGACSFLDELLVDVARMARQETSKIGLIYALNQTAEGWRVRTTLSIPNGFYKPTQLQIGEEAYATLPTKVGINVVTDALEREIGVGFKSGNGQLSISGLVSYRLPPDIHTARWQLVFTGESADEPVRIDLPFSDGFDPTLPWVFACRDDRPAELVGVGSVRLSAGRALVVCPVAFVPDGPAGSVTNRGSFSPGQSVYELTATCQFLDEAENQTYRIKLAEPNDDPYYLVLHPQSTTNYIRFCQKQNAAIFLGFPRLRRLYKLGGYAVRVRDRVQYKTQQHTTWHDLPESDISHLTGRFKVRSLGPESEVLFSREITVLPAGFGVRFEADQQRILLDQTGAFTVSVAADDGFSACTISREGTSHRLQWQTGKQGDQVRLRLAGAGTKAFNLYVPYPAGSGYFLDASGCVMTNNQSLDLQQLYGTHLVLNNLSAGQQTARLTLTLNDRHCRDAQYAIGKPVKIAPFSNQELALIQYKNDIEQLLSYSRAIDAVVRIQYNGGVSICVSQYTAQGQYDHVTGLVTLVGSAPVDTSIRISAFPLSMRFSPDQLVELEPQEAGWRFPDGCSEGEKWFYFSTSDSPVSLRPSVAIRAESIPDDTTETVGELHEASNHRYNDRQTVLTRLFDDIAREVGNVNWATLRHLHTCTAHLPLSALDVWKALTGSNAGLVSFFLQAAPATISKLTRAFSVSWHSIPVSVWLRGFDVYRTAFSANGAALLIDQKLQELESGFSLHSLAQIIRVSLLTEEVGPDLQMAQNPTSVTNYLKMLVEGGYGASGLLHTAQQFPAKLRDELVGSFNRLPVNVRLLLPDIPSNFKHVRPVAYLPVLMAYQTICPVENGGINTLNRQHMSELINFDGTYFSQVYNAVQAFCWYTFPNQ